MKVVVINSPGFLGFFLRKIFGIKTEKNKNN
ncbi:MAG: stage V sporulation protein SpoVM [Clostridia bacterium]|nr:stage V sporulation protein SpoVM [Clostridia bacterium]